MRTRLHFGRTQHPQINRDGPGLVAIVALVTFGNAAISPIRCAAEPAASPAPAGAPAVAPALDTRALPEPERRRHRRVTVDVIVPCGR
jgi:hypothetical protein